MTKEERVSDLGMMRGTVLQPCHEEMLTVSSETAQWPVVCCEEAITAIQDEVRQVNESMLSVERVGVSLRLV
jgi:hypothetical protein